MPDSAGRLAQKQRTREAILDGARQLLEAGKTVSVTDAAEVHGISKATAYRYFSDPSVLVAEAGLAVTVAPYEDIVAGADSLRDRLAKITIYPFDLAVAHEAQFRLFLGAVLVSGTHGKLAMKRGARRVAMFERAFSESDHDLTARQRTALILALSSITGIEAMISLFDIVGADAGTARAAVADNIEAVLDRHLGPKGL